MLPSLSKEYLSPFTIEKKPCEKICYIATYAEHVGIECLFRVCYMPPLNITRIGGLQSFEAPTLVMLKL